MAVEVAATGAVRSFLSIKELWHAVLRIDEPPANTFARALTGGYRAPDRSGGEGGQERLLLHECVRRRVRLGSSAADVAREAIEFIREDELIEVTPKGVSPAEGIWT